MGLIGEGGSILAVPILVYIMGLGAKAAIAMSLVIVGTVSLIGAVPHWLQGNVNLRVAAIFTPTAIQKGFGYFVLAIGIFVLIQHYESGMERQRQ